MPPKEEEVPIFMQGKSKLELKAEKAAAKAARKAAKENRPSGGGKDGSGGGAAGENGGLPHSMSALSLASSNPANPADTTYSMRTVTGVLASRPAARDIKISGFSLGLNGIELIKECSIELTIGRRYGLIGQNGSGKTNFLQCIANREVPIPEHLDIFHLHQEAEPSDMSALEAVIDHIKKELANLQKQEEMILETAGPEDERLEQIYERIEELDPATFEARAAELLHGLGFSRAMMARATKDMSGGWRMRVALARALFASPTLLLLDEPTNHLDLEACVWLEQYLSQYKKCLIIVSHSQDFLNGVCTHIIWLTRQQLTYYTGNYDTFKKTVAENEVVQLKKFQKEQEDIRHIKEFIASCGTYANLVKQAKSKQKILDKMYEAGLTPDPRLNKERTFQFRFPPCDKLPPPVLPFQGVAFGYSGNPEGYLYKDLNFGIDCDSRVALVGPNGAGKSTLLKLITGDLSPSEGVVQRHPHLSIGRYHQHSVDQLIPDMTVIGFFQHTYPNDGTFVRDVDGWRAFLGRYGISGKLQTTKIALLSEGQKCRIAFAMLCMKNHNLLLLDEPTNHLDLEAIDALAEAINAYDGGVVLVSHDFRLIDAVAQEIWVCENRTVTPWRGNIREYKLALAKKMGVVH